MAKATGVEGKRLRRKNLSFAVLLFLIFLGNMNRSVLVLVALLIMAVLVGGYSARDRFLPIASPIPDITNSVSVTGAGATASAHDDSYSYEAVEAIAVRFDSEAPVAPKREPKVHPVDVLTERAKSGASMLLRNLLRISSYTVSGNYYVDDAEVARIAGVSGEPWIWESPFSSVESRLRESPWVSDAKLSWTLFPLSVGIEVVEAKPWLVAELGRESWLISRKGTLLQPLRTIKDTQLILDTVGLPRLDGLLRKGEAPDSVTTMSSRLAKAVSILGFYQIADEFPFPVDRFTYLEESGILITPAQRKRYPAVIVDGQSFSDAKTAMANLRTVLHDVEKRQERAVQIDMRFHGQAVVRLEEEVAEEVGGGKQGVGKKDPHRAG